MYDPLLLLTKILEEKINPDTNDKVTLKISCDRGQDLLKFGVTIGSTTGENQERMIILLSTDCEETTKNLITLMDEMKLISALEILERTFGSRLIVTFAGDSKCKNYFI